MKTSSQISFKSRQTLWISVLFILSIGVTIFAIISAILKLSDENLWINGLMAFLMALSGALVLWIWLGTRYIIREGKLYYYSGPVRGSIPIENIRKLEVGRTLWVGLRPALATGGIIVHFGNSEKIYISPKPNEKFVQHITSMNENIIVKNHLFK